MAKKDIEQILDDWVVPEMSYEPAYDTGKTQSKKTVVGRTNVPRTIEDVPEVVLPKTKAEVYKEAKGRLTEKTSAVSKRGGAKPAQKRVKTKTVELEIAAVAEDISREHTRRPVEAPEWVGSAEELVPFAWRMPLLTDIERPSKIYKQAVREARELLLPVPRDK